MPKTRPPYSAEFRRQMVDLVRAGRSPEDLAQHPRDPGRIPCLCSAQPAICPQFSPQGAPLALLNPKLEQRVTLLCNDGYAAAASGVTHGTLWSAEHLTAADVVAARDTLRAGSFHADSRMPFADQAQLGDYRGSGYDRGT